MAQTQTVPGRSAAVVTPSDSTVFDLPTRGIYVGVGGNLSVEMEDVGSAIIFVGVQTGALLPLSVTGINATGTTATNILRVW